MYANIKTGSAVTRIWHRDISRKLSRNPAGPTPEQIKQLTRPRGIMVRKINLDIDPQVKKDLKDLAAHQAKDPYIKGLKDRIIDQP
jgi:hypothetical protein